jgi:hypothetical protein
MLPHLRRVACYVNSFFMELVPMVEAITLALLAYDRWVLILPYFPNENLLILQSWAKLVC